MIIGTCSLCGGPVSVPDVWFGIYPPVPQCNHCGASKSSYGPVIDMTPKRQPLKDRYIAKKLFREEEE